MFSQSRGPTTARSTAKHLDLCMHKNYNSIVVDAPQAVLTAPPALFRLLPSSVLLPGPGDGSAFAACAIGAGL